MVTKLATPMGLKLESNHFWIDFETYDRFINIEHKQIPKRYFNRLWELSRHTAYKKDILVFSRADI